MAGASEALDTAKPPGSLRLADPALPARRNRTTWVSLHGTVAGRDREEIRRVSGGTKQQRHPGKTGTNRSFEHGSRAIAGLTAAAATRASCPSVTVGQVLRAGLLGVCYQRALEPGACFDHFQGHRRIRRLQARQSAIPRASDRTYRDRKSTRLNSS